MDYRIVVMPRAQRAIDRDIAWIRGIASRQAADRWFDSLMVAIASLSVMPNRCPFAPESRYFDDEVRLLLYGRHQHQRRVLFTSEADTVHVIDYRHGRRRLLDTLE